MINNDFPILFFLFFFVHIFRTKILFRLDFPHGPGTVYFTFQTGSSGNHLVTTGSDGTIAIYNRQGQLQDRIVLQAYVAFYCDSLTF